MKEKILTALKTKYSNLGFSSKVLDGIASSIEKSVTDESQIETAVGGIESILKVFQSDFDRARTEYGTLKGQYDELKKKPRHHLPTRAGRMRKTNSTKNRNGSHATSKNRRSATQPSRAKAKL